VLANRRSVQFDPDGTWVYNAKRRKGNMLELKSTKINHSLEFVTTEAFKEEL